MKRFAQIVVLSALFAGIAQAAFAQTFSIQGVLRDPLGRTVEDGNYSLTFRIYDVPTGGTALWTETLGSVEVKHGVFAVELGTVTSMSELTFDTQYYIGISVEDGPELEPRIKVTSAPSAYGVFGVRNTFPSVGSVGVGTPDPQAALHIVADPEVTDDLLIQDEAGNPKLVVNAENHVGVGVSEPTATLHIQPATDADNNLLIEASNGDDMLVVTPDGKMGIGVDAPTAALHIQPAEDLSDNLLIQSANGDTQVVVTADGKMGVGVGNPQHPLAVNGNLRLHSGGAIVFDDGTSIASAEFGGAATAVTSPGNALVTADADTDGTGEVQLVTGDTPRLVVQNDGDVGIGTDAPTSKLSVVGDIDISGPRLHVGTDGKVGIGTANPTEKLDVRGTIKATSFIQSTSGGFKFPDGTVQTTAATTAPVKILSGSGTGSTYITFSEAFSSSPHVVACFSGNQYHFGFITIYNVSTTGFGIIVRDSGGQYTNDPFYWIAVGQ